MTNTRTATKTIRTEDLTSTERVALSEICLAAYLDTISRDPIPAIKLTKGVYRYNILVADVRADHLVYIGWAATPDARGRWSAWASRPSPQNPADLGEENTRVDAVGRVLNFVARTMTRRPTADRPAVDLSPLANPQPGSCICHRGPDEAAQCPADHGSWVGQRDEMTTIDVVAADGVVEIIETVADEPSGQVMFGVDELQEGAGG